MAVIHWSGAIIGLAIAIILIFRKVNPVYALLGGAIIGGVVGGASLAQTTQIVIDGTNSVMGAVVRVLAAGVLAAIMVHTGAVVIDHLPHGNFFHATADSVKMNINERMKLIPYESIVGGSMVIVATILYGFLG